MTRRDERGVALILVLWLVVVLSAVALEVVTSARAESRLALNFRARAVSRYAAESGIEAATTRLEDLLAQFQGPFPRAVLFHQLDEHLGALRQVHLDGAEFSVEVQDLNARIDLNLADGATLVGLFSQFVPAGRAVAIADALQDWRDEDDLVRPAGAERVDYDRAGRPWLPRNGLLQHASELGYVMGMTDSLLRAMAPYVAVGSDGRVNVNSAPEIVLAALPELGGAGARAIVGQRQRGGMFSSPHEALVLVGASSGRTGVSLTRLVVSPTRVLVVSRGWLSGHPLTHEIRAVYDVAGTRPTLYSWSEHDE